MTCHAIFDVPSFMLFNAFSETVRAIVIAILFYNC